MTEPRQSAEAADGLPEHREPVMSVLIVDDHALVGTALARSLRDEGLQANHCAGASTEAILAEAVARPPGSRCSISTSAATPRATRSTAPT